RVVRAARLHLRDATSDKVYDVDLIENEALGTPAGRHGGMRVVRAARLHLRDATSDKVYDVDLIENEALGTP
ncbi:hypothetical protein CTI14_71185, partial [Methylobacterium radiotolerans]